MSELALVFSRFIAGQSGAGKARVLAFSRLSGGAIQDNFGLTLELEGGTFAGRHSFVVRQDAPSGIAESLSRAEEFRVLQAAREAGVTTPQPLWLCADPGLTGKAFYVMTKVSGTASGTQLVRSDFLPAQRRKIAYRLGTELARLHSIRPPAPSLDFLPLPDSDSPARSRVALYRRYLQEIGDPYPVLEWALNWLEDHAPEPGATVLCHCDLRTGNYMLDGDELTAILDWEFASWSDPCEDLGWLCSRSWRFGADHREVGGIGDKTDLLAGYRDAGGLVPDTETLHYWEVMALVRWAMIALQQARRHTSGEQRSLELALTGRMVGQMEYDLLNQIGELEGCDD